ncbi:hypothetical protein AB0B15_38455 [Streptomyces sp. NPDC045456]|uniref:hypothetical protein n=1 Tax=Streptomyces sp. NPDC045456 TaxID=3155254 RepID=UPI0033D88138
MAPHRAISPDDCPTCRKIFAVLEDRQKASPDDPITTEEIGRLIGFKKRATQNHLAHLFQQGRIDADRRTPLPGVRSAGQPALPGAVEWATRIVETNPVFAPDPTCAKCLVALARYGWSGQVNVAELAAEAGVSVRSVERHRPHLVEWDLVRFRIATVPTEGSGVFRGRKPSYYTLMSGFYARPLTEEERVHVPARAAAIIDRVRWYVGVSPEERENAETAVGFVLRAGWPEAAILKALDASEDRNAFNPTGYLHKLLGKLRGQRYLIPAQEMVTGEGHRRLTECSVCRNATWTAVPAHGRVLCGGDTCLEGGTDHDTRDVLPIHRSA